MAAAIMKRVSSDSAVHVSHDASQQRFEVRADDAVAFLAYERRDGRLVVIHTEVPANLGGRGIGGQLVQAAVALAREDQLKVLPLCPFARTYLRRHPELSEA
jgi:predicted GNAT family acetyltransferase